MDNTPKRPHQMSRECSELTARKMIPLLEEYLDEDVDDEILREFVNAIQYEDDKVRICTSLDAWDPCERLYDVLDHLFAKRRDAERELVATWIKENKITLSKRVGDAVKFKSVRNGILSGEITQAMPESAQYCIFVESLGHVREGVGTHGMIVNEEDLVKEEQ